MMSKSTTLSLSNFSSEAAQLIEDAQKFADSNRHPLCDTVHLLAVIADVPEVSALFKQLGVNTVLLNQQVHSYLHHFTKSANGGSSLSEGMRSFLAQCSKRNAPVNTVDLLVFLANQADGGTKHILESFNITPERINSANKEEIKTGELRSCAQFTNLTSLAKSEKFETVIGRDAELRRITQILGRRSKNHPLLVGESGVGKRTIVMAIAERMNSKHCPDALAKCSVLELNTIHLISGVKQRSEVEERFVDLAKKLRGHSVIVYIRSMEALTVPGLNLNLNDIFNTFFANNVRVIASCSIPTLKTLAEKDAVFLKEFTQVAIEPTNVERTTEILRGVAARYKKHHGIKIGENAISNIVKLAKRYIQDRSLPESAIDLLDEASSNRKIEVSGLPKSLETYMSRHSSVKAQLAGLEGDDDEASLAVRKSLSAELDELNTNIKEFNISSESSDAGSAVLTDESIASVLSEMTGIPASKFLQGDTEKLSMIEERLGKRVIGQDEAIKGLAKSVRRSYLGLRDPSKPIGSFLFLGSSGCGKTEIAKALAEFLFDDETAITRIDCSEMQERHMAQRLIGSPPGYEGSKEGGMLTEAVRKKPYSVLLFDEIEKAHADVFNLLLQVLDDGRLTDGKGFVADFSNTIVIMTSNIGSKNILEAQSKHPELFETLDGREQIKDMVNQEVKTFLRPEFINRIDETIVFRPLGKDQLFGILNIQLANFTKRLASKELTVNVSQAAKQILVEISYEPAYGARPLKRAITRHIQDPIAEGLVNLQYPKGTTIGIDYYSDNFVIQAEE